MQLERCKLFSGTLFYNSRFTMSLVHHVIFTRDNFLGTDVFTGKIYPVGSRKGKGYNIGGFIHPLDELLKNAGYDEILTEKDRERMFNEDCKKIFLESRLLENIDVYTDDPFHLDFYKENPQLIKSLFTRRQ